MGILHLTLVEEGSKMKFIIAACLVAAVFAEPEAKADADAALLYGAYGYGGYASPYSLGYAGYGGLSAYRGYAGYAYGAYPYTYGAHYIGKRSADAEPEAKADAALLYGAYGYGGYAASPYYGGYAGYAASPYYGGYAYGAYPYTYGAHYLGKRSADAEPEAKADADAALLYSRYGYASPYVGGYASVYSGYRDYAGLPYAYGGYPAYGAYSYLG